MNKKLPTLLFLIGTIFPLIAQDGHYWTQQYGTRSMLLSGSVIGGVEDLGAVYYNPGRLAVISNSAFLLSANVYESNTISISDAFGTSKGASQSTIRGVPTLAAGTFKIKKLPKHFFAYAIMTRQSSDLTLAFKGEEHDDLIALLPGDEYFGAEISLIQKSSDTWTGLTWSYALSSKLSIGVTTNFSVSSQSKGANINLQALSQANEVGVYRYDRSVTFKQNGLLWKIGTAYSAGPWTLGLTVTTPVLQLSGSGTYQFEEFFSSIPALNRPEVYSSSYQNSLDATVRTPWSVGMGITRNVGRNRFHASTEWYSSVPKYMLMQAKDHPSQSDPTNIISFALVDQLQSVWNAGVGAEIFVSEHVSGFASFSTDYAAGSPNLTRFAERKSEAANTGWITDFYHVGGGIVLKLKGADVTLGATHTGANQTIQRPVNFPDNPNQPIFNSGSTADARWDRWRLVFSFSFPFLKNYTDKLSGGETKDK